MHFRRKFGFLVVLAVFFLIFALGCDSGSVNNVQTTETAEIAVNTESDFSSSLESLASDQIVVVKADIGTETSSFQLDKNSGIFSVLGDADSSSQKEIAGELVIGNGSTIDVTLANLNFTGSLVVDIGNGELKLNNVNAPNLEIKSGSVVTDTDDSEDSDSNPPASLENGYLKFYLSTQDSNNAVQSVMIANNGNGSDKSGKPDNQEITEVNVVIERIEFKNNDGSGWQEWEAFSGPQQVDLLSENLMQEFIVEGEVTAGDFSSIRLYAAAGYDEDADIEDDTEEPEETEPVEEEVDTTVTPTSIFLQNTDSISSGDSITTEDSVTTGDSVTTDGPIDVEEENDYGDSSYIVYADGSEEELWVHAAANAGIKINGDFSVESGTTTELNISFDADELINMRGPKVAPMLMPKAFNLKAEKTRGALEVEIENYTELELELEDVEILLTDSESVEKEVTPVEGEEGLFLFSQLEAGEYTLNISSDGYQPIEESVTIVAGELKELTYSLTEAVSEIEQPETEENI